MKRLLILTFLTFTGLVAYSQGTQVGDTNSPIYHYNGNVGIGTLSPSSFLHIKLNSSGKGLQILGSNLNVDFHLGHTGDAYGFYWRYKGEDSGNNNDLELWSNNQTGTDQQIYNVHQDGNIRFYQKVSIGCEAQNDADFAVHGIVKAEEVKVTNTIWSDFVFEPNYNLPTLQEVENFINQNGHLPDIPSAEEVKANGVSLGDMDAKLLQKIEELTLYLIELKKENQIMKNRITLLENEK